MAIFGDDSRFEKRLMRYHELMAQEQQAAAQAAAKLAPEPAPSPIPAAMRSQFTIEFCMWLQNVWAEELRAGGDGT